MATRPRFQLLLITSIVLALAMPGLAGAAESPVGATPETAPVAPVPPPPSAPAATGEPAPAPAPTVEAAPAPQVQAQHAQGSTPSAPAGKRGHAKTGAGSSGGAAAGAAGETRSTGGPRAKSSAPSPSALTPSLPLALQGAISGVPAFFIESFRIPPFLLPIFQAAGTAYGIPWQVLAAINEVETDYGRDLSVSSAGAEGWMQFLPSTWAQYGVDANGDGYIDPYNPADAIFAAARYLRAAGGAKNIKASVFSYNHSQAYVDSVMLRAQLLGGTPAELLGAITGLTEARFPVHAAAHFSDGFPALAAGAAKTAKAVAATTIYAHAGSPVIAVQDGEVTQIGRSPALGHYISLRDAFGNTYVYAQLGDVAPLYPVLAPHQHSAVSARVTPSAAPEPAPSGPATAGAQPRSPMSPGATVTGLAMGAAAGLEGATAVPAAAPAAPSEPARAAANVRVFTEGANDVYLHPLRKGVQVIAGTVLGHVGAAGPTVPGAPAEAHIIFQIRPAGANAPSIDPKPILDGWVALENTSIFRARGENPFLATSPTTGQVLLESKQQLEPQVLHDAGVRLGACGRQAVQSGRVDKRVLAMLEYLSVSALRPTVSGLKCSAAARSAAANAAASADSVSVNLTAINGVPVAGHQGQGSLADTTIRKLLMLQGASRPVRIVSLMSYPGSAGVVAAPSGRDAIRVGFASLGGRIARAAGLFDTTLTPSEWVKLVARLGEIPDPTVASGPSQAAIRVAAADGKGAGANGHG